MLLRPLLFFVLLFTSSFAHAQFFEVDTIRYNGAIHKYINVVLLSDGYQTHELDQFIVDATDFTEKLFVEPPYAQYQNYFNVFAIKVPSNESGASHPGDATDVSEPAHEVKEVDNYFGSTFDAFGIHRLLVADNATAVFEVLANNFPAYDQILILANSPYYGGSGGFRAVTSLHSSANEIAIHEMGHSFAYLKDEYYAGDQYAGESINMTQQTNPALVKWKNWHGEQGVGIYQHCCGGNSAQWYRPHENCKMRALGLAFCAVCVEGTIERIHHLNPPILDFSPGSEVAAPLAFPLHLQADLIAPIPNTLKREWYVNGVLWQQGIDSIQLSMEDLIVGPNTVDLVIEDTTQLLRVNDHSNIHLYTISWTLDNNVTHIGTLSGSQNQIAWRVGPNPTTGILDVHLESALNQSFQLVIYDANGQALKSWLRSSGSGTLDVSALPAGTYITALLLEGRVLTRRSFIKQ